MSIFDRLGRLARAEINEMKRVLAERDEPRLDTDAFDRFEQSEADYQRSIADAEAELARDEADQLAERGASIWGNPSGVTGQRADLERGASMWGPAADEPAQPTQPPPRTKHDRAATQPYEGRTNVFPREVREAYAALELPLGADREQVDRAFRELLHRYHPDKHMNDSRRHQMANDLTIRIREARDILMTWVTRT